MPTSLADLQWNLKLHGIEPDQVKVSMGFIMNDELIHDGINIV